MGFYRNVKWIVSKLLPIFFKLEFIGFEKKVASGKGYIICCNHVSNLDSVAIAIKVDAEINFLGKAELFKNAFLAFAFRKLNVIPVTRGKGNSTALEKAVAVVKSGGVLGIFPEGTRSKDGKLKPPKSGAVFVALAAKADILPMGITFEKRWLKRSKIVVKCGEMIRYEDLMVKERTHSELRQASKFVMAKISELIG
ncbi:MAG: 1-acyl-sn-glycerol-3-phosphate acyltransferase [Oscillospiraceae bacterium]|nr:1-acyl-sn-glycerol-3-phosphate acyltransferase [Oscillospiraceae bacterium]